MDQLQFYTVDEAYIDYLSPYAPHLFRNASAQQHHSRKYLGIVLSIDTHEYFAPLSSFKEKHRRMKDGLDFIKVKDYAVINLNCMFPVPPTVRHYVDFPREPDAQYRALLLAEYRVIKRLSEKIKKNAANLYKHKITHGDTTRLAARCNDFHALESACDRYQNC